jgi:hypothetical protein
MERRELLKTLATGVAGIGAGMTLFDKSTGNASAAVSVGEFAISDGEKTTQDGQISDVLVEASGSWEYEVPAKKEPDQWQVVLQVSKDDETAIVGVDQGEAKYLTNSDSWQLSGSLLDTSLYAASDFEEDENGATNTVEISSRLWFQVFNAEETEIARAELSDSATVGVTNKAYDATEHGSVGGSGEIIVQA